MRLGSYMLCTLGCEGLGYEARFLHVVHTGSPLASDVSNVLSPLVTREPGSLQQGGASQTDKQLSQTHAHSQ